MSDRGLEGAIDGMEARSEWPHFEDLLADLAASFVNVGPEALDALILAWLERIVRFLGLDRGSLGRYDVIPGQLVKTHSWAVPGVEPIPSPLPESQFPYLAARLRAGQPLVLERLADLPAEAHTDRLSLERLGLRSAATFPLRAGDEIMGWLSFGGLRTERAWPGDLVRRLRLTAGVFANALLRQRKELELNAALAENLALRERVEAENAVWREEALHCRAFEDLVGESPSLKRLLHQIGQVATTDSTVLILGETGTGKELVATAVHRGSRRADRPLIRVNCAALPAALVESELFGHEKGAFTGAIGRKIGRFEVADGGTLVLDEIGELPLEIQVKLLRVLQSGEFERLGSTRTLRTDTRVIASTNRDLERMVREGGFRQDLFYRLGVFPILVPPLRERREDIRLLTAYFVERLRARLGSRVRQISESTVAALMDYDWPGNVRELENLVERSMILSPGAILEVASLPRGIDLAQPTGLSSTMPDAWRTLEEVERAHIRSVCERCGWRISGAGNAAERLGLHPNTLRSRMRKLGISRPLRLDS